MDHRTTHSDARRLADELVAVHDRHDFAALARLIFPMLGDRAPNRHLLGPLFGELVGAVAGLIRTRDGDGDGGTFTLGLTDESDGATQVYIDELDPAVRAVLRAVLADLNGDAESAATQVGFASGDPNSMRRLDALIHLLMWVNHLHPAGRITSQVRPGHGKRGHGA